MPRRELIVMTLAYFGSGLVGAAWAFADPAAQARLDLLVGEGVSRATAFGPLDFARESLQAAGKVPFAVAGAIGIFLTMLLVGSLSQLTLPSGVVPFGGIPIGLLRALVWGLLFAPVNGTWATLLVSLPVLLLEGEGYVLTMLGVWEWWLPVVRTAGSRREAWRQGLRRQPRVYLVAACFFAAAATLESFIIVFVQGAVNYGR
jgi:hypothetical protein